LKKKCKNKNRREISGNRKRSRNRVENAEKKIANAQTEFKKANFKRDAVAETKSQWVKSVCNNITFEKHWAPPVDRAVSSLAPESSTFKFVSIGNEATHVAARKYVLYQQVMELACTETNTQKDGCFEHEGFGRYSATTKPSEFPDPRDDLRTIPRPTMQKLLILAGLEANRTVDSLEMEDAFRLVLDADLLRHIPADRKSPTAVRNVPYFKSTRVMQVALLLCRSAEERSAVLRRFGFASYSTVMHWQAKFVEDARRVNEAAVRTQVRNILTEKSDVIVLHFDNAELLRLAATGTHVDHYLVAIVAQLLRVPSAAKPACLEKYLAARGNLPIVPFPHIDSAWRNKITEPLVRFGVIFLGKRPFIHGPTT